MCVKIKAVIPEKSGLWVVWIIKAHGISQIVRFELLLPA